MRRTHVSFPDRRGVAAVEFAVILPLAVLLLFGATELARALMVKHTLQEAAQASCRIYSVRDTTFQDAQDAAQTAMTRAGLDQYSIGFDPPTKGEIDQPMESVTVTVSVDYSDVAWIPATFLGGSTITAKCTLPAYLFDVEDVGSGTYNATVDDNVGDGYVRDGDDDD